MLDEHLYHSNTVVASSQVERGGLYWGGGGGDDKTELVQCILTCIRYTQVLLHVYIVHVCAPLVLTVCPTRLCDDYARI